GTLHALLDLNQNPISLSLGNWNGSGIPKETSYFRRILNKAKNGVGQICLHQHIAWEELALGINLATATNLNNLFGRHDNVLDLVRKPLLVCLIQNRLSYLLL